MLLYIWLLTIVAAVVLYFRQRHSRFNRHGVKHLTMGHFLWNTIRLMMKKDHFAEELDRCYKGYHKGQRFIGRYEFSTPLIIITDIELVKKVMVKDFEHFVDHRMFVKEVNDPLFGRNLFSLRGDEWKDMRPTLSPAFTSSKIRLMIPFMMEVGTQMIASLKKKLRESNNTYIDIDVKDLTTRYANDVIASCAFGLNVDSHANVDNMFYRMGKRAVDFGGTGTFLKFLFFIAIPKLMAKLKISLFSDDVKYFFINMVTDTMNDREARNIVRPDMIHLLMEVKKGRLVHEDKAIDTDAGFATVEESNVGRKIIKREWSDTDLIAQAILFFIAGFETVSSTMSFVLHELAVNPDVQERLAQEIKDTDAKNGGKLDYNSIQNMTYMDMVVSEVLRLWPPVVVLDRACVKDYNLGKPNDDPEAKDYYLRPDETVFIPAYSIHRDPQYFPNPLKFDPERFSEENKHNIQPFTYLPFGAGPRNCIGSRFALCEVKVMLYQLLLHLELSPNEKTCIPARLNKSFNFILEGGHWLRFKPRN